MITLTDGSTLEVEAEAFGKAQCFWKRKDIRSVVLPDGIKTIRKESFYECVNLESVTIPYGVTTIEPEAFGRCGKLRHVTLPESVKVVGSRAFAGSGLTEMILTPRIKQMGKEAFGDCPDLKRFVVPAGYKADSFGVYRDKVEEMVVPAELEHLFEDAPRDEWYHRLPNKNLDELLPRFEEDAGAFPVMVTLSGISEDLDDSHFSAWSHHIVSPETAGPFFNAKETYEGLRSLLKKSLRSLGPGDLDLLAANLVVGYMAEGRYVPSDMFDLTACSAWGNHWDYTVCFHPLPGLRPEKPVYAAVAALWHSASFHPSELLLGFASTKTAARQLASLSPSFRDYPYSQDKPEIIECD